MAAALAVLAMGSASSLAPIGSAMAQTAGTAGPISLGDLFTGPDSLDLKPDAEAKLREAAAHSFSPRGGCAQKAKFNVIVPQGDPLFQQALAGARREVIRTVLANDLMFSRLEFGSEVGTKHDVQVDYDRMQDREKPKLHTSSVPPKGSKVKPGDQIKVTMVARDDATTWQTGIQRIQLIAQTPGGDELVRAQDYPPVIRANCEGRPEPRTLVVTYRVPQNPPPIVRLRAITEDFVGLIDADVGEFPTGDWYGRFEWKHACRGGGSTDVTRGIGDLSLDHDGRGNLTGRLTGSTPERSQTMPTCSFRYVAPGNFSAKLVGSYTPGQDTFSVQAVEVRTMPGRASWTCPAGTTVTDQAFFAVYEGPMFRDAFRDLRRQPDRSLKSDGEQTFTHANGSCTTNYSLTLLQARN
jgi:hypothetical protein